MSGGHWDYVGFRIRDDLNLIASDEAVKKRWPRVGALLADLAVLVEDAEHEMDWDLSSDFLIEDNKAFEDRIVHGILESAMKVADDRLFPRGKWASIQAVADRLLQEIEHLKDLQSELAYAQRFAVSKGLVDHAVRGK